MNRIFLVLIIMIIVMGCKTTAKPGVYDRYVLKDFNLMAANTFVKQIDSLKAIDNISLSDIKKTGKEFRVNGQHIYTDTSLTDMPNFYNYKRRAAEINVDSDTLLQSLNKFYAVKADTYKRTDDFYIFIVEHYLTYEKGFVYCRNTNQKVGDTISYYKYTTRKHLLTRQVDAKWFEYEDL